MDFGNFGPGAWGLSGPLSNCEWTVYTCGPGELLENFESETCGFCKSPNRYSEKSF